MKHSIVALLFLGASFLAHASCDQGLLDTDARRLLGASENLCESYGGKVVLVVNTASQCGYTGQYEGLQTLWKTYGDRGLVVLGFPSDQFGGQEYDDEAQIAKFCKANYGVTFPVFGKSQVTGDAAIPLFKGLAEATGSPPQWNFHKYLVGRDGQPISAFGSDVEPEDAELITAIETALGS